MIGVFCPEIVPCLLIKRINDIYYGGICLAGDCGSWIIKHVLLFSYSMSEIF